MTPEESEQIAFFGAVFFQNISSLIFGMGLFGCYQGPTYWLSSLACISFYNLLLVKFGLVVSLPGGLMAQAMAANLILATEILGGWLQDFLFLIADTAIVWRAWALWAENRLIKWTLLIILLADIGLGIADGVLFTKVEINSNFNTVILDSLSTALNLTLIVHGYIINQPMQYCITRNHKWKQFSYLWLSQVQFLVYYSALDIHAAEISPIDIAAGFLDALYIYSAALNPVALVILIQTGHTYEHSFHLEDVPSLDINSAPNVG
ncbi:hypothetical protein BT96DRAFT_1071837 [Gymnopus androsaceus JB14]|uniref:Uncharacterized protein n=1 Tax=Gymnopus androsaceus JB14 TaxID=1447944 RepID=A0A6A4GT68_9AGAR|nr:hypothetical protein BT96DRAFT_1071837 [Gymnopus androsaceus JB14]